jgi:hypothetical protein
MISAFDDYRSTILRKAKGFTMRTRIVTNGRLTRQAQSIADEYGILCLTSTDMAEFLRKTPCTFAEVKSMESRRKRSMREVEVEIDDLLLRATR